MSRDFLHDNAHWRLLLDSRQPTLGAVRIESKRQVESPSQLNEEEWKELNQLVRDYEEALLRHPDFHPNNFNYLQGDKCNFYGIPRYVESRTLGNKNWRDPDFGKPISLNQEEVSEALLEEIAQKIRQMLSRLHQKSAADKGVVFYFVRHGETEGSREKKALGHLNVSVNERGRAQANRLKEWVQTLSIDHFIASDLLRSYDTAKVLAQGKEILTDKRLRSRNWGELTGQSSALLYLDKPELFACVETSDSIAQRVFDFLNEFVVSCKGGEQNLVICHGSIMRVLLWKILGFNFYGTKIEVKNTSHLKISTVNGRWKIDELHDIELPPHLIFMDNQPRHLIKEYSSWNLSTNPTQHTLGSALITCKRIVAEKISDLTVEEWQELQQIMREYEGALARHFQPYAVNYSQLGFRRAQFQAVPRYQETKHFAGTTWNNSILKEEAPLDAITEALSLPSSNDAKELTIIRHGETEWNRLGKKEGHSDVPLNETGKKQALALQKLLSSLKFDKAYASDLKRAYETAEIIMRGTVEKDPRLRERDFADWEGKSRGDYRRANPEELKKVETSAQIAERVFAFLEAAASKPENRILIVAHSGVIRIILSKILGLASFDYEIGIRQGSIVKIIYAHGKWSIGEIYDVLLPSTLQFR